MKEGNFPDMDSSLDNYKKKSKSSKKLKHPFDEHSDEEWETQEAIGGITWSEVFKKLNDPYFDKKSFLLTLTKKEQQRVLEHALKHYADLQHKEQMKQE